MAVPRWATPGRWRTADAGAATGRFVVAAALAAAVLLLASATAPGAVAVRTTAAATTTTTAVVDPSSDEAVNQCAMATWCGACTAISGCGWCQTTMQCMPSADTYSYQGRCNATWLWTSAQQCFSESDALGYLFLSYAAYCSDQRLLYWTCKWCGNYTEAVGAPLGDVMPLLNSTNEIAGYVGVSGTQQVVVVFRGTVFTDLSNWVVDLESAAKVPFPPLAAAQASVADGFYKAYSEVRDQAMQAVAQAKQYCGQQCTSIVVTGHSLGAAIGTLFAAELLAGGETLPLDMHTFGCPRVGDSNFYQWLNGRPRINWRMTNENDPVPHVPLQLMGFHHVAVEVWFNRTAYLTCDTTGEDPNCSNSQTFELNIPAHLDYMGYKEDCRGD